MALALAACLDEAGPASAPSPALTVQAPPPASPAEDPEGTDGPEPEPEPPPETVPGRPALVTRVVDGDTIEVLFRGDELDVRLIGIDTPETVAPGEPVQCFGPEASAFTERELEGERVMLELDVERVDRYGRTLAYVWNEGRLFNRVLVARGFAVVSTYPPNVKYVDQFVAAQRHARERGLGLWGACAAEDGGADGDGCDPSYPDVCIPPPPPDLDCADVRWSRFRVVPPDPHGFDGDDDGIGCET